MPHPGAHRVGSLAMSPGSEPGAGPVNPAALAGLTGTGPVRVGGRLQEFWQRWESLLPDSNLFNQLRTGIRWWFSTPPPLTTTPVKFPTPADQVPLLEHAAQALLEKGVVEPLTAEQVRTPGFYSRLFLRPKPSGEYRPIIDLSTLNEHIECPTFKMETVQSIRAALQPGEWCAQLDIRDAYLHVPVRERFRKYLRFSVGDTAYQFKALPFGLNVAPRIFTKILKPVLAKLRSLGIKVHGYLDDWLIRGNSPQQVAQHVQVVTSLLTDLGWMISWEKSNLVPTQVFTFLGLQFDLRSGTVRPGDKGLHNLVVDIKSLRSGDSVTVRRLSSIIGKAKHWAPYVPRGRLQLRSTQKWFKDRWTHQLQNWAYAVTIDPQLIRQLRWWTQQSHTHTGVPLHPPVPVQDLYTDASDAGWGAQLGNLSARGRWDRQEMKLHINQLELRAVRLACSRFRSAVSHKATRVHMDNTTAVAYIRKEGGTHSWALTQEARRLFRWCDIHHAFLVPVHISGVRNVRADGLSRIGQVLSGEWAMSVKEFRRITLALGRPSIDLMATADNAVVSRFFSPIPHPDALAVDGLSQVWPQGRLLYIYPPSVMVPRVIQKIRESPGVCLILIASMSTMRAWHVDLRELATRDPIPVCREEGSLWQCLIGSREVQFHPRPNLFQLGAWLLRSAREPVASGP